jgi:leucyl-tRNA synthetase
MLDRTQTPTGQSLRVFTTRPDTIFGATYMVVAPEHPLVDEAIEFPAPETDETALRQYAHEARNRSDVERMETRDKSGVFTGYYVTNPATRAPIPVWTSDYVLMGYGTGAIMAVPAHDQRDGEFAAVFDLPVRAVVEPPAGEAPPEGRAFTGGGIARNSANDEVSLDGLPTPEAKARIVEWLEAQKLGRRRVNYRLRDWLFSRQRYWGEPFPVVWDQRGRHHPVAESALPVTLPDMADYAPVESEDPQPLLAKAEAWVRTTAGEARAEGLDPESPVTRETNTMPGWAGSCWYYLRYCDPRNNERFVGDDAERYWMGGGIDRRRSALRADAPVDLPVDRRSEPMREEPPNRIAQSAQLMRRGIPRTQLDTIDDAPIAAAGFVPRDPYPPGEYGPARELSKTARNLPHFEMPDATYFVTWRTSGERTLTGAERDTVLNSLLHFDDDRCRVYALCVMPDHVHWLVRPLPGHTLAQLVSSVKRFSARAVNDAAGSEGSLWQPDRFDHVVRDSSWFREFLEYIVHNPVEANMCERPSEYPWLFVHQDVVSRPESEKSTLDVERDATHPSIGSESRSTRGGVDLYIGGAEHAVLHLLYARFWHKVLFDLGHLSTDEPFRKLFHQGLITSHAYQRADKTLVPIDEVETDEDGRTVERATGQHVTQIVAKMSKSLKNVVNPDDVIRDFGADTFRLYEMYMGPLEASKPWNTNDTIGLYRFLQRAWRLAVDEQTGELKLRDAPDDAIEKQLHRTIAKVGADIERLAFNTAIAAMIELVNAATASDSGAGGFTRDQLDRFARVLAPFAPHMGEELWHRLGHENSVAHAAWPPHDEAMLRDDQVEIAVQVMGKVRARLTVPADADAETLKTIAMADPAVAELIAGKTVRKVVAVPGRLVNIVAN